MPPATRSHSAAGESTPPGNRHAIPTTAIGSSTRTCAPAGASGRGRPAQQLTQVGGQLVRGGVVEGQGERQFQLGDGLEPVKQLGGLYRVEPQVLERELGVDVVGAGMAQHRCRLRAHLRHQQVMLLLAECAKSLGQSRVGPGARTRVIDCVLLRRADRPVYAGELITQVQLYAVPSPDLAACGEGNRTGLHQNEIRHTQTVRSRYRRGDVTPDGGQPVAPQPLRIRPAS